MAAKARGLAKRPESAWKVAGKKSWAGMARRREAGDMVVMSVSFSLSNGGRVVREDDYAPLYRINPENVFDVIDQNL